MRPLTEDETRIFFEKLAKYIGANIKHLIDRQDGEYVFRLHNERVYYCNIELLKIGFNAGHDSIVSIGTCFGKFSKTKKFRLHITSLAYLAQYAKYKIWIKQSGEMSYLYGNNLMKQHLGRITENTGKYVGCILYNMNDLPIGFAVTAYSTGEMRKLPNTAIVAFHQSDIGEYLRVEQEAGGEHNAEINKSTNKNKKKNDMDITMNDGVNDKNSTSNGVGKVKEKRQFNTSAARSGNPQQPQRGKRQKV